MENIGSFSSFIGASLIIFYHCLGYEDAALKTQRSLALLNLGQNIIFSTALSSAMVLCSHGITDGTMTIGDLVKLLSNIVLV